jgi:hypothetical protein
MEMGCVLCVVGTEFEMLFTGIKKSRVNLAGEFVPARLE